MRPAGRPLDPAIVVIAARIRARDHVSTMLALGRSPLSLLSDLIGPNALLAITEAELVERYAAAWAAMARTNPSLLDADDLPEVCRVSSPSRKEPPEALPDPRLLGERAARPADVPVALDRPSAQAALGREPELARFPPGGRGRAEALPSAPLQRGGRRGGLRRHAL